MREAEPHRSLRIGSERLVHERCAVGARPRANAELGVQQISHRRRIDVRDIKRHDARTVDAAATIYAHAGDFANRFFEPRRERLGLGPNDIDALALDVGHARQKPGHAMRVERARFQVLGHEGWMLAVVAVGARAAHLERCDLDAFGHAQSARALGAVQALVAGEAHDVYMIGRHVDRNDASGLGRVDHEQRPVGVRDFGHANDIVHVARQVGGVRHGGQARVRLERRVERAVVERAVGADRGYRKLDVASILHAEQRPQHRVVRRRSRDGVVARPQQPADGDVQRLGRVVRERELLRPRPAEQIGQLLARRERGHARIDGRLVHAAPDASERIDGASDRNRHLGRLHARRSCVVEIDHASPS